MKSFKKYIFCFHKYASTVSFRQQNHVSCIYRTFPGSAMWDHLDHFTVFSSDAESILAALLGDVFMIYSLGGISTFLKAELWSQRVWMVLDFWFTLLSCPPKRFSPFIFQPAMAEGACMPVQRIFSTLFFIRIPDRLCGTLSISFPCLPKCPC